VDGRDEPWDKPGHDGDALYERAVPIARAITAKTLELVEEAEQRATLIALLRRLT